MLQYREAAPHELRGGAIAGEVAYARRRSKARCRGEQATVVQHGPYHLRGVNLEPRLPACNTRARLHAHNSIKIQILPRASHWKNIRQPANSVATREDYLAGRATCVGATAPGYNCAITNKASPRQLPTTNPRGRPQGKPEVACIRRTCLLGYDVDGSLFSFGNEVMAVASTAMAASKRWAATLTSTYIYQLHRQRYVSRLDGGCQPAPDRSMC